MSAADAIERLLGTTTDIDGDTLSINNLRLVEGEGTLTQNADGSYTFTPAENYNGLIRASYTVNDGNGASINVNASLIVNPVNDAPVSTGDVDFGSIDEDGSITMSASDAIERLLGTTTDIDGDTLSTVSYTHLTLPTSHCV